MENSSKQTIFDLAVIGNGIAAQSFLWNLNSSESKSQNFSIAHIFSEELTPACTLRSSATVSLNGIQEDVSPLGNDMRESYFLFDDIYKKYKPDGVERVKRVVVATQESEEKKLLRRYKSLSSIKNPLIANTYQGVEYDSYIITPDIFCEWIKNQTTIKKTNFASFAKDLKKSEHFYSIHLLDGSEVLAKKILFATGAFSKIFERFYQHPEAASIEEKNSIKPGSYLERDVELGMKSFYLSIDGHQVLYRHNQYEKKLIIGSVSGEGAFLAPDVAGLAKLFTKMKSLLTFSLGDLSDYKIVTGLRHKGPKRLLISECIDGEGRLFRVNGLYKNGYSMSFLAAKRLESLIFSPGTRP